MEQVAAIWVDGSDIKRKFDRSIMLHGKSGEPCYIRAYYGCYDPLAYPFFYSGGETGWKDKKVLLEEFLVKHFPRVKRKYTRRKKSGIVRLLYDSIFYTQQVMYIMYIKLNDV